MIEEIMKHFGRNHLMLDMSSQGLFTAARAPNESCYILQDQSITFNKKMAKIRDKIGREAYRINIFQVPHFKI
jgi:hypothetical protein